MKTRHILLCLTLSLLGSGLEAQNELPQVFSPNAAEIGKYGKIPVSYFNGLPNISIPLTELKAMNYTLPIYLTYHASGNKPDQHPGWVGLGWTLHAGGCINRIEHGMKDEMTKAEASSIFHGGYADNPGNLYHASEYQNTPVDSVVLSWAISDSPPDMDPDEFQVNFEGLNSSFYIVGTDSVRIASANPLDYKVHIDIGSCDTLSIYGDPSIPIIQYDYIKTITITTGDGVVYRFGGDDDAIDFAYELDSPDSHALKREVTSWNITSIDFPGGEKIIFEYVKSGIPIVTLDRHYFEHSDFDPWFPLAQQGYTFDTHTVLYDNLHLSLISPSYLREIRANKSREEISFFISPSVEKEDPVDSLAFKKRFTNQIAKLKYSLGMSSNFYQKLDSIVSPRGKFLFDYTATTAERLKLQAIAVKTDQVVKRYGMRYNTTKLPDYHSRHTDMWGYYSQQPSHDESGVYYLVDTSAMKAEILEALEYPTGGKTWFEYEAHRYGKIAHQYPFCLENQSGIAGGLRIKRIIDEMGEKTEIREFRYVNDNGGSSGILAEIPRFSATGTVQVNGIHAEQGDVASTYHVITNGSQDPTYLLKGERQLNQIPLTGGCHVTYSRVEERFQDDSKTVYHYTNHEQAPDKERLQILNSFSDDGLFNHFTSNELNRGLLRKTEHYSRGRTTPVRVEEIHYAESDTTDCAFAIKWIKYCHDFLFRASLIQYYTFHPAPIWKRVTEYPDEGNVPHIETTDYTYDSHRRLTGTTRRVAGTVERDTLTYTGNYSGAPYSGMAARNMISYPVEQVHFRKDTLAAEKVIGAELTTWKQSDTLFLPAEKYRANVGSGLTGSFSFFNGNTKDSHYDPNPEEKYVAYDSLGNILLTQNRADYWSSYTWTPDGCHPAAVIPGAKQEYKQKVTADVSRVKIFQQDPDDVQSLTFTCMSPFILRIWLTCPNNQCWDVTPVVDGTHYRIVCVNDPSAPNPWPANASSYPSPLEIPVTAGTHTVRLLGGYHSYTVNSTDPGQYTIELNYKEMQETEQPVPGHTVVFEDFEEDGNYTLGGFQSGRGHVGTWSHSLYVPGGPYIVDYRVFRNGKWNYVRQSTSNYVVVINEGSAPIDHVRIFPVSSLPESFTWNKDGTLRSRTDSRGITQSYRYDGLGRLVGVYDNDGKKVEGYEYNYQNQEDE